MDWKLEDGKIYEVFFLFVCFTWEGNIKIKLDLEYFHSYGLKLWGFYTGKYNKTSPKKIITYFPLR